MGGLYKYMYVLFFSTIMVGVGIFTLGGEFLLFVLPTTPHVRL